MTKITIATGIIFAFISIMFSAMGSHALKPTLVERNMVDSFQIASSFMMYHGLALIVLGIMMHVFSGINFTPVYIAFVAGSLLFQGMIYLKSFVDVGKLSLLNPVGGSILFAGWLYLLFLVLKNVR